MASPVTIQFTTTESSPDTEHLLARILFTQDTASANQPWLIHSGLEQLSDTPICEDWLSETPVSRGLCNHVHYAANEQILFGWVALEPHLPLDQTIRRAYQTLMLTLKKTSYPYLSRTWHYFSDINMSQHNTSRYHLFCRGRNQAFEEAGLIQYCAATVIGTPTPNPIMFFIASKIPPEAISNPDQDQPWEYPNYLSTDKPVFVRAVKDTNLSLLFISGTASIVGSQSKHPNDVASQCQQILTHLTALLRPDSAMSLNRLAYLKVYLNTKQHKEQVKKIIHQELLKAGVQNEQLIIFSGEVCRPELIIEMEALAYL